MTKEEMQEVAADVISALKNDGRFQNVELLDFTPGQPLPIAFDRGEDMLVLELTLA